MKLQRRLLPSISAISSFEAVARLLSFTAAAEELSLTQSAVSRQVKILEEQLGCLLFERTSKMVTLTPTGAAYAEEMRKALAIIRGASVRAVSGTSEADLRLAILPTFGTKWLMPRIPHFVDKFPNITLSFSTNIYQFEFTSSDIDGAIYHGLPDWPGTQATLLMEERLVPVAAPSLAELCSPTDPESILGLPRLHLESRPADWKKWAVETGVDAPPAGGMVFEQFSTLLQACLSGMGTALFPDFIVAKELAENDLVALGDPVLNDMSYYFVQPRLAVRKPSVDAFRHWIASEAQSFLEEREK